MGDPFAQMRAQMRRMQQEMMSGFPMGEEDPFMDDPFQMNQQRRRATHPVPSRGVQIEELDEDADVSPAANAQPIVEEPDDPPQAAEARQHQQQRQQQQQQQQQRQQQQRQQRQQVRAQQSQMSPFGDLFGGMPGQFMQFPSMGGLSPGAGPSFSYSSSSFSSSSGPNGVTYQETRSSRMGPDGVMEQSHTVRDGRTGEERMRVTRGLGERQRTLEHARRNGEDVHRAEILQGIQTGEEAQRFDSEWLSRAVNSLTPDLSDIYGGDGSQQARAIGNGMPSSAWYDGYLGQRRPHRRNQP